MNKKALPAAFLLALVISVVVSFQSASFGSANPQGTYPELSMPVEYVNYTVTSINGSFWAKIDGNYPIYIHQQPDCTVDDLPMVYPMPPGSEDIHVWMGEEELSWQNYTESFLGDLHHTAIGDWWLIYAVLPRAPEMFVLRIHYEHPLQSINGSYLFLYDLNINPYLSEQGNTNSTCYYTVCFDAPVANVRAYTTKTDIQWNPIDFNSTHQGNTQVISICERSQFGNVPGDLVVMFDDASNKAAPDFAIWVVPVLVAFVIGVCVFYFARRRLVSLTFSSKTSNSANTQVVFTPSIVVYLECLLWAVSPIARFL